MLKVILTLSGSMEAVPAPTTTISDSPALAVGARTRSTRKTPHKALIKLASILSV
jgi:hypothetical protein